VSELTLFNGLAFLALYVVTYGGNEFMKPDEGASNARQNSEQQPVTASIIAVLTHSALQDCQDFCGA
jgi:hypothetical protein